MGRLDVCGGEGMQTPTGGALLTGEVAPTAQGKLLETITESDISCKTHGNWG